MAASQASTLPRPAAARKVAVIGAGFAGLGAARLLKSEARRQVDVTVLESSQRVGGRACTLQVSRIKNTPLQEASCPGHLRIHASCCVNCK